MQLFHPVTMISTTHGFIFDDKDEHISITLSPQWNREKMLPSVGILSASSSSSSSFVFQTCVCNIYSLSTESGLTSQSDWPIEKDLPFS